MNQTPDNPQPQPHHSRIDRLSAIEPWLQSEGWVENTVNHVPGFKHWDFKLRGYPSDTDVRLRLKVGSKTRAGCWNELLLYQGRAVPVALHPGHRAEVIKALIEVFAHHATSITPKAPVDPGIAPATGVGESGAHEF